MKLLLSSHSVRDYNPEASLALAGDLDFDGIELFPGRLPADFDLVAYSDLQQRFPGRIVNVHMPSLQAPEWKLRLAPKPIWKRHIRRALEIAKTTRASTLVVHPFPASWLKGRAAAITASAMPAPGEFQASISIENPGINRRNGKTYDRVFLSDPGEVFRFCEDHDRRMTLDTSHCIQRGMGPIEVFRRCESRINNIHLSNYSDQQCHQPLLRGEFDLAPFLATLRERRYGGTVTLETRPLDEADVRENMRYLADHLH